MSGERQGDSYAVIGGNRIRPAGAPDSGAPSQATPPAQQAGERQGIPAVLHGARPGQGTPDMSAGQGRGVPPRQDQDTPSGSPSPQPPDLSPAPAPQPPVGQPSTGDPAPQRDADPNNAPLPQPPLPSPTQRPASSGVPGADQQDPHRTDGAPEPQPDNPGTSAPSGRRPARQVPTPTPQPAPQSGGGVGSAPDTRGASSDPIPLQPASPSPDPVPVPLSPVPPAPPPSRPIPRLSHPAPQPVPAASSGPDLTPRPVPTPSAPLPPIAPARVSRPTPAPTPVPAPVDFSPAQQPPPADPLPAASSVPGLGSQTPPPAAEHGISPQAESRPELPHWSTPHSQWRLVSPDPNALRAAASFTGTQVQPDANGLYHLQPRVTASLKAHLDETQSREWNGMKAPRKKSKSKEERKRAKEWEKSKKGFMRLVDRKIVADPAPGQRVNAGEMSESFAYQLYHWMQESSTQIIELYLERPREAGRITQVLSSIGFTDLPMQRGGDIVYKNDAIMRGLWNVYQELHMKSANGVELFIEQVASVIKSQHQGSKEELRYAMDMFRTLPFFGKDGKLMDAIELAILSVSQEQGTYAEGFVVQSLDPQSREGQTIAYIAEKAPNPPAPSTSGSQRRSTPHPSPQPSGAPVQQQGGGVNTDDDEPHGHA